LPNQYQGCHLDMRSNTVALCRCTPPSPPRTLGPTGSWRAVQKDTVIKGPKVRTRRSCRRAHSDSSGPMPNHGTHARFEHQSCTKPTQLEMECRPPISRPSHLIGKQIGKQRAAEDGLTSVAAADDRGNRRASDPRPVSPMPSGHVQGWCKIRAAETAEQTLGCGR
jgi:hypothetical protein